MARPGGDTGLEKFFQLYNRQRPHQALGYQTPAAVYFGSTYSSLSYFVAEIVLTMGYTSQNNFAFNELGHELRQDMLRRKIVKRSKLTAKDFKHHVANPVLRLKSPLSESVPPGTEGVV